MTIFDTASHDHGLMKCRYRIMCSNRDEFLSRPTEFAHFHSFEVRDHNVAINHISADNHNRKKGTNLNASENMMVSSYRGSMSRPAALGLVLQGPGD